MSASVKPNANVTMSHTVMPNPTDVGLNEDTKCEHKVSLFLKAGLFSELYCNLLVIL